MQRSSSRTSLLWEFARFKFVGQIRKMGEDNRVIWIPKKFHKDIIKLEGKQVRIQIDDEI